MQNQSKRINFSSQGFWQEAIKNRFKNLRKTKRPLQAKSAETATLNPHQGKPTAKKKKSDGLSRDSRRGNYRNLRRTCQEHEKRT